MTTRHYTLRCPGCGWTAEDDGLILCCPVEHEPALLVTDYEEQCFHPDPSAEGVFRYSRWLPATRRLPGAGTSVTYYSAALNRTAVLRNL